MEKKTKLILLELIFLVVICSIQNSLIIGYLWIILHEAVHILVAKYYGLNLYGVELHLTGAMANIMDIDELSNNKKLLLYLSGPLFNFFAMLVLMAINGYYDSEFIEVSISLNFFLGVFNLIPAYPLDGIRVYEILLGKKVLYKKAKRILCYISFVFSGVFILLFFLSIFLHKANFTLLLAGVLMTYTTYLETENTMYILMGDLIKKRKQLVVRDYLENKSISVYYKKGLVNVLTLVDRNKFNSFYILDDELKLIEIIYEDELIEALKRHGNITLDEYIKSKNIKI